MRAPFGGKFTNEGPIPFKNLDAAGTVPLQHRNFVVRSAADGNDSLELTVCWTRAAPLPKIGTIGPKHSDPRTVMLPHVDVALIIRSHPVRAVQLPIPVSGPTHRADKLTLGVKNLHTAVLPLANIDLSIRINVNSRQFTKLPRFGAVASPFA